MFLLTLALHLHPARLLVNPVFCFIGKLSLSLYLCHFLVEHGLQSWLGARLAGDARFFGAFILILSASLPCAYVMYRLIEQPGIAYGARLGREIK